MDTEKNPVNCSTTHLTTSTISDFEPLFVILWIFIELSKSIEHVKYMASAAVRASNFYLLLSHVKATCIVRIEARIDSTFCDGT